MVEERAVSELGGEGPQNTEGGKCTRGGREGNRLHYTRKGCWSWRRAGGRDACTEKGVRETHTAVCARRATPHWVIVAWDTRTHRDACQGDTRWIQERAGTAPPFSSATRCMAAPPFFPSALQEGTSQISLGPGVEGSPWPSLMGWAP